MEPPQPPPQPPQPPQPPHPITRRMQGKQWQSRLNIRDGEMNEFFLPVLTAEELHGVHDFTANPAVDVHRVYFDAFSAENHRFYNLSLTHKHKGSERIKVRTLETEWGMFLRQLRVREGDSVEFSWELNPRRLLLRVLRVLDLLVVPRKARSVRVPRNGGIVGFPPIDGDASAILFLGTKLGSIPISSAIGEAARDIDVSEDFLPIISRIRASIAPLGGPKGEILYAREHVAVWWFKVKQFVASVWSGSPGEQQIKQLKHVLDLKGMKVCEEWFTRTKVEDALMRYHEANEKARAKVLGLLRGLSAELQHKINVLVSDRRRRKWVFPTLVEFSSSQNGKLDGESLSMEMTCLFLYWFDIAQGNAVCNTVNMKSLFLLTGPNGGCKSSLLRSVCAAALLGICGFMVSAESASIPYFDAVILHTKSYDSLVDGKSSFQIEMSEMRSLLSATTSRSLVLVDEICRGTEIAKGACIAGSVVETLDAVGCLGIVSTHLHGIDLPLRRCKSVNKAMTAEFVDGQTIPTWKLVDGICKESLAFETAQREGVPKTLVKRAEDLHLSVYANEMPLKYDKSDCFGSTAIVNKANEAWCDMSTSFTDLNLATQVEILKREVYNAVTDGLQGRVQAHRLKDGMQNAAFLSFVVQGKSVARQLETLLINQLPK